MEYTAYYKGEWVPVSAVQIDPLDRGFYVGDTVYEVERTFNGKSFRMKEHIDRLYRSLKYVRIDPGLSPAELLDVSEEAIKRNHHLLPEAGDFLVRQFVTRGRGRQAWLANSPVVCVMVSALDFENFYYAYTDGFRAAVPKTISYPPQALDPKIKHYSRMNFNIAEMEANDIDPGAKPVLRDEQGNLTEGSGYNVFLVTNSIIRSPGDRSILQGVSRTTVYGLAERLGITVAEGNLQPYDLYTADEVFFATTPWCIAPVTYVDRLPVGDGSPGRITRQLIDAWSGEVGVDIVDQAVRYGRATSDR